MNETIYDGSWSSVEFGVRGVGVARVSIQKSTVPSSALISALISS